MHTVRTRNIQACMGPSCMPEIRKAKRNEMRTTPRKVISIPLDVVSRDTGYRVKTTHAQLKVSNEATELRLLAACEEGMFEARFTQSKLRKTKVKKDLEEKEWDALVLFMFDADVFAERTAPMGYDNVIFHGTLTSLEQYDPGTGDLVGDELSETPPSLELSLRTNDTLSVEYGVMALQHVDMDELAETDRGKIDLLGWIEEMSVQTQAVRQALFTSQLQLSEVRAVLAEKERAIEEMESDYKAILRDMEDRFFQVLLCKKRKIAELEGGRVETFEALNVSYKERQKCNLKILNLEDIIVGADDQMYGERRPKRRPKPRARCESDPPSGSPARPTKQSTLEHVTLGSDPVSVKREAEDTLELKDNGPGKNTDPLMQISGDESHAAHSSDGATPDPTDYSESESDGGHVSNGAGPGADDAHQQNAAQSDEGNETEYSE